MKIDYPFAEHSVAAALVRPGNALRLQMLMAALLALLLLTPAARAADDFLQEFVLGNYLLVGKAPDSNSTYYGKVIITSSDGAMTVTRRINGKVIRGSAAIESALNGEARVLRIRFAEQGENYEETCVIGSDLDNYARISCYLYRPGIKSEDPGLETLFHDHLAR